MLSKIISSGIFYSQSTFINWLQNHLIHCPLKYITGIDCPLCGFQRSVLELIQGNFHKSFMLYPPAIPVIVFFAFIIAANYLKLNDPKNQIKNTIFILTISFILICYCVKLWAIFGGYKTSA